MLSLFVFFMNERAHGRSLIFARVITARFVRKNDGIDNCTHGASSKRSVRIFYQPDGRLTPVPGSGGQGIQGTTVVCGEARSDSVQGLRIGKGRWGVTAFEAMTFEVFIGGKCFFVVQL